MGEPTYEGFLKRNDPRRGTGFVGWLLELKEGEFLAVPAEYGKYPTHLTNCISQSANLVKDGRLPKGAIVFREIDGAVWACRLKPEDVPHA